MSDRLISQDPKIAFQIIDKALAAAGKGGVNIFIITVQNNAGAQSTTTSIEGNGNKIERPQKYDPEVLRETFIRNKGNLYRTAKELGLTPGTAHYRVKKLALLPEEVWTGNEPEEDINPSRFKRR
jgi:hypothetical protein